MANPFQGDDVDPFSGARDEEGSIKREKSTQEAPKKMGFGAAFRAARSAGNKTFEWNGKKYTTELKEEKTARETKPTVKPSPTSAAMAEGSFMDRQAYKRATQTRQKEQRQKAMGMKKGGSVSASKRADGCAVKGKTRGKMV